MLFEGQLVKARTNVIGWDFEVDKHVNDRIYAVLFR